MPNDFGQRDIVITISKLLDKNKIPYLLTGSFAVSYHGFIRATHDIDFIVEVHDNSFQKVKDILIQLGTEFDYSFSDVKDAIRNSSQFNIYHLPTGLKIDFWLSQNDEFEKNKFKRIKYTNISGQKVAIISAEDLILNKLKWCKNVRSERHLRDCSEIIKFQGKKLDKKYLSRWARRLKVEKLLEGLGTENY